MLYVKNVTAQDLALVYLIILVIPTRVADRNVFRIQIALIQRLVLTTSVRIHVWERAELTRNAKFIIINHLVVVSLVTPETLLRLATYQ